MIKLNKIRKRLVAKHLGLRGCEGHREVGKAIAEKTAWLAPESVGKGMARRLIEKYFAEILSQDQTFKDGEVRKRKARQLQGAKAATVTKTVRLNKLKIFKTKKTWKAISEGFFASDAWRKLRYKALQVCGGKCQCCGATQRDGALLHVDHVKPRFKFPELELELSNLQVLCSDCNVGKGAWDETDWRTDAERAELQRQKEAL